MYPAGPLEVGDVYLAHFSGLNFLVKSATGSVTRVSSGAAITHIVITAIDDGDTSFDAIVDVQTPHLVHALDELGQAIARAVC